MCDHLRSAPASPVIPWIQGEARRIGVLISNQRYTALPSPYDCQTRNSDSFGDKKSFMTMFTTL
ncbi:hypothetical protein QUF58_06690 [Anaerolineales bacterium HSG24]|nr:hypothetical protein [Anaerolineales bacterium HSG24]